MMQKSDDMYTIVSTHITIEQTDGRTGDQNSHINIELQ